MSKQITSLLTVALSIVLVACSSNSDSSQKQSVIEPVSIVLPDSNNKNDYKPDKNKLPVTLNMYLDYFNDTHMTFVSIDYKNKASGLELIELDSLGAFVTNNHLDIDSTDFRIVATERARYGHLVNVLDQLGLLSYQHYRFDELTDVEMHNIEQYYKNAQIENTTKETK